MFGNNWSPGKLVIASCVRDWKAVVTGPDKPYRTIHDTAGSGEGNFCMHGAAYWIVLG